MANWSGKGYDNFLSAAIPMRIRIAMGRVAGGEWGMILFDFSFFKKVDFGPFNLGGKKKSNYKF